MFCRFCGTQLDDHVKFCTRCGKPVEQETASAQYAQVPPQPAAGLQPVTPPPPPVVVPPTVQTPPPPMNGKQPGEDKATLSMALGIASIVTCGNIACILAIVFGVMAKKEGYQGNNANIGIACGSIGAAGFVLALLGYILYMIFVIAMI